MLRWQPSVWKADFSATTIAGRPLLHLNILFADGHVTSETVLNIAAFRNGNLGSWTRDDTNTGSY
jgi:prepilin-type processing-associated H-X9-DG protein